MVWYGVMVWCGIYGVMVLCSVMVWCDMVWCDMVWCGMVWRGVVTFALNRLLPDSI